MLTLMLLRHAKAREPEPGTSDMDRDLAARGKRAAQAIGRHMAARDLAPELVLCSPARRAMETWRLAAAELAKPPRLIVDGTIYDFGDGDGLLDVLGRQAGDASSVLIAGHNPSIEQLAQRLATCGDKKLRARLAQKYPTAALAVIAFDAPDWSAIGTGKLIAFVRPKDILAEPGE
jgi:phosphohistidine phosphatase